MSVLKAYFKVKIQSSLFNKLLHSPPLSMSSENGVISSANNILMPPSKVYGMKVLDRDAFGKEIEIPAIDVPTEKLKASLKDLKPYLLKMLKLLPVQGDGKIKKILLNPTLHDEMQKKLSLNNIYWTKLTLSYENFNHENIFKAVLPPDTGGNVSSFSIIGHIIHLNLKPELLDYKYLIGQVLLDKYHIIQTVVNKVQTIESDYRNFEMELLAGEPNFEVTVKENGFQYAFDFSKVFWNPRLVHEHAEIVKKVEPGDVVFDVFAGVGPFAIPLAKKKCVVYANDLNPHSYKWLSHNAKLNKISDSSVLSSNDKLSKISDYLTVCNLDGREFIQTVVKDNIIKHWNEDKNKPIHILMNLPACALEFLDAFQGLLKDHRIHNIKMPVVYCYFFLKKDEGASDVIQKCFKNDVPKNIEIASVRLVAPNKRMMRLTYEIPASILFNSEETCCEPDSKRIKLSS